jgi:hypothetical protein
LSSADSRRVESRTTKAILSATTHAMCHHEYPKEAL